MSHTPGPWNIQGGRGRNGELYIWKAGEYFGGHAIATVHESVPERADDNAALISAAPELLDELTSLLEFAHAALAGTVHADTLQYYETRAEVAIAKATRKKT